MKEGFVFHLTSTLRQSHSANLSPHKCDSVSITYPEYAASFVENFAA